MCRGCSIHPCRTPARCPTLCERLAHKTCAVCQRGTRNLARAASCATGLGAKLLMFMFGRRSVGFELAQVCGKPSLCSYKPSRLKMENSFSMTPFWRSLCIKCIFSISQKPLGCWLRFTAVLIYSMYPARLASALASRNEAAVLSPELI